MKSVRYILYACAGLLVWLVLFGMGIIVDSQPYRTAIAQRFDWLAFVMAVASYTPTNTAVLAVATGFVGGCGSLIFFGATDHAGGRRRSEEELDQLRVRLEHPSSSAIRGFFGYLVIMAGAVVGSDQPFAATTPEQYWRLACSVSLLSFILGFDATFFRSLVGTVSGRLRTRDASKPDDQAPADSDR
jgi:hypothetical protein